MLVEMLIPEKLPQVYHFDFQQPLLEQVSEAFAFQFHYSDQFGILLVDKHTHAYQIYEDF